MNLTLRRQRIQNVPREIGTCLRLLGVTIRTTKNFWLEHEGELEWLLRDAHHRWRDEIKKVHGDYGGSHEAAVVLNALFDRIKSLFRNKGVTLGDQAAPTVKRTVRPVKREWLPPEEREKRRREYRQKFYRNQYRASVGIPLNAELKSYYRGVLKAAALFMLVPCLLFAEPPSPPPLSAVLRWTPPRDVIYEELSTNVQPITVRVTVSSNVIRRTIWWKGDVVRTNYAVLESNVLSCVTNTSVTTP